MIESIETSLHLLEYKIYESVINLRQRLRKRKSEPIFDSDVLEAYK